MLVLRHLKLLKDSVTKKNINLLFLMACFCFLLSGTLLWSETGLSKENTIIIDAEEKNSLLARQQIIERRKILKQKSLSMQKKHKQDIPRKQSQSIDDLPFNLGDFIGVVDSEIIFKSNIIEITPEGNIFSFQLQNTDVPQGIAVDFNRKKIAIADISSVCILDINTGEEKVIHGFDFVEDVAFDSNGDIIATDMGAEFIEQSPKDGAIFRIDQEGKVSNITSSPVLINPRLVDIDVNGNILISDEKLMSDDSSFPTDTVLLINNTTGSITDIINKSNITFIDGLATAPNGMIWIAGFGELFRLNPSNGKSRRVCYREGKEIGGIGALDVNTNGLIAVLGLSSTINSSALYNVSFFPCNASLIAELNEDLLFSSGIAIIKDNRPLPTTTPTPVANDTISPSIKIDKPENGSTVTDGLFAIEISYSDNSSGVDTSSLEVTINGTDITSLFMINSDKAIANVNLTLGQNSIEASIQDDANNKATTSVVFTVEAEVVDGLPPASTQDIITTAAGNGTRGFEGDGGLALKAQLNSPRGFYLDNIGNIFIADTGNNRIRKINPSTGIITTIAGNGPLGFNDSGTPTFSGDGGLATSAQLDFPEDVFVDSSGNIFIADSGNDRIRKVDASTGIITTIVGNGTHGQSDDGGLATDAELWFPGSVALDSAGNIIFTDLGRIRKVDISTGRITTIAGTGTTPGFSGDGGLATNAQLSSPNGISLDSSDNLFIADSSNYRIRKIDALTGIITTIAGDGTRGFEGDGGLATDAELWSPRSVALDSAGNIIFADFGRIRKVDVSTGIITTIAGDWTLDFSGDCGLATSAGIAPWDVFVDSSGNLFISDAANNRIRTVSQLSLPTLTSISPNLFSSCEPQIISFQQIVSLTGSNFIIGMTINVSETGVTVSDVTRISSTSATATFTIDASTTPGERKVSINSLCDTSNTVNIDVNAPCVRN